MYIVRLKCENLAGSQSSSQAGSSGKIPQAETEAPCKSLTCSLSSRFPCHRPSRVLDRAETSAFGVCSPHGVLGAVSALPPLCFCASRFGFLGKYAKEEPQGPILQGVYPLPLRTSPVSVFPKAREVLDLFYRSFVRHTPGSIVRQKGPHRPYVRSSVTTQSQVPGGCSSSAPRLPLPSRLC